MSLRKRLKNLMLRLDDSQPRLSADKLANNLPENLAGKLNFSQECCDERSDTKFAKNNILIYLALIFFVLIFDRVSKSFVLTMTEPIKILKNFIYLEVAFNNGISWGLFSSENSSPKGVCTIGFFINLLIIAVILYLLKYIYERFVLGELIYGELLILAGALANLFDRFYYGAVIDFIVINFGFWGTYPLVFPVFNFADIAIVLGGAYVLIQLIFSSKNELSKIS